LVTPGDADDTGDWTEEVWRPPFTVVDCEGDFDTEENGDLDEADAEPAVDEEPEPEVLGFEGLEGSEGAVPEGASPEDPDSEPKDVDPEVEPVELEPVVPEELVDPEEPVDPVEPVDPEDVAPPPTLATSLANSDNCLGRSELLSDTSDMYTAATPLLSSCEMTVL